MIINPNFVDKLPQIMSKIYRPGAIGALSDEYEKALNELKTLLSEISDDQFNAIADSSVKEDFQSVRNIVTHVVKAGYSYANYIRKRFGNTIYKKEVTINAVHDALLQLDNMFHYTVETFEDKWLFTDDDLLNTVIKTSWTTYDLEAIIEHSIVHILRHRLQIEKLLIKAIRQTT